MLETVGLKALFDGAFCTCDIGVDKKEKEFYRHILSELDLHPEEVLFFDDSQANVDAANALGIESHLYTGLEMLRRRTDNLIV
ncbi:hypothetical protein COU19_02860 [Candidatus Kaiserbacteria bacterium CG10_big_fil_rev_8_21_14_0_10_56_12]|uniref:HAD family phosphatase n=1 Tax=Candidatus Kaiserbacteria bacterium CG10_big_fil_rev_8_21_14_0_10_56_12 TaxID=1974611 RepID=A0A2H0U9E4_9BACT|nr:MAG: hypothetical protein COU19_02860 [Candidatus Kaiserbacteria bacterium CG10_big_fil_rev_8_21_14_0_10_56_12]